MKQIKALSACLLLATSSCSDDKLPESSPEKSEKGERSVTFAISKSEDEGFDVSTKTKGTVVTDSYVVEFYLFKQNASSNYELIQKEKVVTPLYTIEDLELEGSYKYVFVATSLANASALDAIDFSSVQMDPNTFFVTLPSKLATPTDKNRLENCYLSFFDNRQNSIPNYGTESSTDPETITVQKDLDIFGCGALIQPGMTYNTPVNVVMERQFGVVEFRYTDARAGDKLTCSFSSDYYRLYLSQLVRTAKEWYYVSDNSALFPAGIFELTGLTAYSQGDYYSASSTFKTGFGLLPVFTKSKILSGGENSIQVYVPYTTAEAVGTSVADIYKANYVRTEFTDISGLPTKGPKGTITLKVERNGTVLNTYSLPDSPFPIYQNGKTVFTTVGNDYFQVNFGPASGTSSDGIHLDPDGWHGE